MEKEINIIAPEGYEIDKENSTLECIKFKAIQKKKRWRDKDAVIGGYYINDSSEIIFAKCHNTLANCNVFATKKQAKSALAMARISQIMANDERFGGVVTDEEWADDDLFKFAITRKNNHIETAIYGSYYDFLAFHTKEQRDLFLKENEDLVKDYLML